MFRSPFKNMFTVYVYGELVKKETKTSSGIQPPGGLSREQM